MTTKRDVARALKEIAFFLRLKGENPYRARAYERAGRALLACPTDLGALVSTNRLAQVDGIGPATAAAIAELFHTGSSTLLQTLRGSYPSSLVELGDVPGLRMKQIMKLYDEAGIRSVAELQEACRESELLSIRGIGEKVQARILAALGEYGRGLGYHLYADVLEEVAGLEQALRTISGVQTVTVAGAVRRRMEVINRYDFVVCCEKRPTPRSMTRVNTLPNLTEVTVRGDDLVTALSPMGVPITIRLTTEDYYGIDLLQATGSPEHLDQLITKFKKGFKNWNVARDPFKRLSEDSIYRAAGLPYIFPELREGRGELELTGKAPPRLIEPSQIQGFFHFHTEYSDGSGTVEQMVEAARERGYRYLGISEHSQSAFYAGGLKEPRIRRQWAEISAVQRQYPDIHIFKGIEADILPDGSMDYPDDLLAEFDFVIASVHSRFNLPEADQTRRICRALAHPSVTMLGHPTGRLLLSRAGYRVDLAKVIATAATHGKVIEINGSRHRLDLDWRWVQHAKQQGVKFCVNPDAHAVDELENVRLGVNVARKGGLEAQDVVNTNSPADMKSFLSNLRRSPQPPGRLAPNLSGPPIESL